MLLLRESSYLRLRLSLRRVRQTPDAASVSRHRFFTAFEKLFSTDTQTGTSDTLLDCYSLNRTATQKHNNLLYSSIRALLHYNFFIISWSLSTSLQVTRISSTIHISCAHPNSYRMQHTENDMYCIVFRSLVAQFFRSPVMYCPVV